MYNEIGQPIEYEQHHIWEGQETVTYNPVAFDDRGNRYFYDETKQEYVRASTGAMDSPGNPLVGNDLAAARNGEPPTRVSLQGALSIYKGYSMPDIVKLMELDGYTYNGNGFVKTGESATLEELQAAVTEIAGGGTAVSPEVDDRGRPLWVDAAALAEGERVTAASGVTYVGGQQYTNPAGQTVGQYAITLPGEGDRWAYKIKQDSDGNWVRIYYQKNLRSQASINRRRRRAAEQASEAPQQIPGQTGSTLVNLRADYG